MSNIQTIGINGWGIQTVKYRKKNLTIRLTQYPSACAILVLSNLGNMLENKKEFEELFEILKTKNQIKVGTTNEGRDNEGRDELFTMSHMFQPTMIQLTTTEHAQYTYLKTLGFRTISSFISRSSSNKVRVMAFKNEKNE